MSLFLHLGLPKTGTTTIQKHLFEIHPQVSYLGKFIKSKTQFPEIDRQLQSIYTGENITESMESWNEQLAVVKNKFGNKNTNYLLSEELLYGLTNKNQPLFAERLKTIFSPDKILITIRNQPNIIKSVFRHRRSRGREKIDFCTYLENNFDSVFSKSLDYFSCLKRYEDLFGEDNCKVLVIEEFIKNPDKFLSELFEFLEIKKLELDISTRENEPLSERNIRANKALKVYGKVRSVILPNVHLGKFVPASAKKKIREYFQSGVPPSIEYSTEWNSRLDDYFAPINSRFSDKYNIDLNSLGYPVEEW